MKIYLKWMWIAVIGLFMTACTTTQNGLTTENTKRNIDQQLTIEIEQPQTLADFLIKAPNVFVNGSRWNARVTIRGSAPLYVLDGVILGCSYTEADNVASAFDIASVEVVTDPAKMQRYSRTTVSGVVLINTVRE